MEDPNKAAAGRHELVIDDPAIVADIEELSARTGETPARAVHAAVEQRLKQMPASRTQPNEDMIRQLERLGKEGAMNKLPGATSDHSFLYDDDGLPI
jgi:hypothetical protein